MSNFLSANSTHRR